MSENTGIDPDDWSRVYGAGAHGPFHDNDGLTEQYDGVERERRIAEAVERLRVNDEARRRYSATRAEELIVPAGIPIAQFLAEPANPQRFLIEKLMPVGGRVVVVAQYKAGKTTLRDNITRSLSTQTPFLGAFAVTDTRRVGTLDNELPRDTFREWLRSHNLPDGVTVWPMKGRMRTFNILDDAIRAKWADALRDAGVETFEFDVLRAALDALGLDENRDAGRLLEALDALADEAGLKELFVFHHMGHGTERSRGDSRILDWPDATWNIFRSEPDNPASPRYFRAYGRDVEVAEGSLAYDPTTRALTYGEGSRRTARATEDKTGARLAVMGYVQANPGCSGEDIRNSNAAKPFRNVVTQVRDELVERGELTKERRSGRGGGWAYFTNSANPAEPRANSAHRGVPNPANPVYKAGFGVRGSGDVSDQPTFAGFDDNEGIHDANGDACCCPHGVTLGARCTRCGGRAIA